MKKGKRTKPRDPNVVPMLTRKSGAHEKSEKATRREDRKEIQAQLGFSQIGTPPKY